MSVIILSPAAFLILRPAPQAEPLKIQRFGRGRRVTDAKGIRYDYAFNLPGGVAWSMLIGCLSSLLGIGGGAFQVPVLAYCLHFPLHITTATSHLTLAIMSLIGSATHIVMGDFTHGIRRTVALAVGVLVGAQVGAMLSQRLRSTTLIRILALGLLLFGLRLVIQAFYH